jgi:hypothetical protein
MLGAFTLLMDSLLGKALKTMLNLVPFVSAPLGIYADSRKHPHDPSALLTATTGVHSFSLLVRCMAGSLMDLKIGETLRQNFFDQEF